MEQPFAIMFGGFYLDHTRNFKAKIKYMKTYQKFASGTSVLVNEQAKPFPSFEEFKANYDITARMPWLSDNKAYQKYMAKDRGERTPDEHPIKLERPKASPITTVNDGYGNTKFKANLLLVMALLCLAMFVFVGGFWLGLKLR